MTKKEKAKEKDHNREYEEVVEEVRKAASGGMPGMSSNEKLKLLLWLKELKKQLDALPVPEEDKEATDSEISVMQECLLDPSLCEPNPLAPLPLNEYYSGDYRRGPKGHIIGFRGRRGRRIKKGSRIHSLPSYSRTAAEVLIQQENMKRQYEKPIHNFNDLYNTLSEVPFGTHPLLQYGPVGVYDVLVLSDARNNSPDTVPTLPKGNELKGPFEVPQKVPNPLPFVVPKDTVENAEQQNSGKCPRNMATKPRPNPKGLKQDHILLGNNVIIDEEQLKRDIIKELPNVCCVDIEHKEDASSPGTYSAVLVFTYADTKNEDSGKVQVLPDDEGPLKAEVNTHTYPINGGKEATRPKALSQSTLHNRAQLDTPDLLKATHLVPPDTASPPPAPNTSAKQPAQNTRSGHTKVELLAYLVICVVFVVPFCVFWCWIYRHLLLA